MFVARRLGSAKSRPVASSSLESSPVQTCPSSSAMMKRGRAGVPVKRTVRIRGLDIGQLHRSGVGMRFPQGNRENRFAA